MNKGVITNRLHANRRATRDLTPNPELTGEELDSESEYNLNLCAPTEYPDTPEPCCTESAYCDKADRNRTILDDARAIVEGQRRSDYGDARTCFNRIAKMWGGYLGMELNAQDVAHLMIMLKVARNHDTFKRDSLVDVCGYAYCADLIHDQELAAKSQFNGEY